MGRRNCASCKYYERSSIPRMGWCRNTHLFASHHNHLVSADDLDCDRGSGDFWESEEPNQDASNVEYASRRIITLTSLGSPVYSVSGSSGYSGGDPPNPHSGDGGDPPWSGDDRDFNYYEEERYWTDYLRIALPILGVVVLVILLWFWIANFLGDDDNGDGSAASGTSTEAILPTISSSPAATQTISGSVSPPPVAPTATSGGTGAATATTPGGATPPPNGEKVPIYLGATVEVANTDGAGVNVRLEASTSSEVLAVFLDGTEIQVIGGPIESEDFVWWQISGNEINSGWIVDEYLVVVE